MRAVHKKSWGGAGKNRGQLNHFQTGKGTCIADRLGGTGKRLRTRQGLLPFQEIKEGRN